MREVSVGVCILAGGEATRLPGKLALEVGDVPMLVRVYRNVSRGRETWLSTKGPLAPEIAEHVTAPQVIDRWPLRGPLSGLLSTLSEMRTEWVFAIAGDAPFVDAAFIDRLAAYVGPQHDAIVPMHDDAAARRIEPLAALYRREAFLREGMPVLLGGDGALRLVIDRLRALRPGPRRTRLRERQHAGRLRQGPRGAEVNRSGSERAFAAARRVIPGGVNSTVRAFQAVGGTPVFIREAQGAYLTDVDGNRYLDYVLSWGPMIAGHAHPDVVDALQRAALRGTSYGTPTEYETELAELIVAAVPSVEKVRFCSSGTEATANAVRLARGFIGRDKFIKFEGCYHGSADPFLIAAGSSALTMGVPNSRGVPAATARDTIIVPYNDAAAVRAAFERNPGEIAAVIVEPYVGNMGLVLPVPGFLAALRSLTREHGALLIFDEVMTGFRVARGGVQAREGILPDLTTLGKVIGGGLPVGAFGGKAEIMDRLTPEGDVFQAGTLSGNPIAMAAGLATLRLLGDDAFVHLERLAKRFADRMADVFRRRGVPHTVAAAGSMMGFFFAEGPVTDLASAKRADTALYGRFFHAMLDRGFYLAPSQFEAGFLSLAHTEAEIDRTAEAADAALAAALGTAREDLACR